MKILVAVDGSSFTKRMLAYLGAHDQQWLNPAHEYTVLHTVNPLPARAATALDKGTVHAYYEGEADQVFKPLRTFFKRHGIDAKFVGKVGPAADTIAAFASKGKFDLLVLGSHGHGSVAGLVLGSVSTKVVARCDVPVLLIR